MAQRGFPTLLGLLLGAAIATTTAVAWADAPRGGATADPPGQHRFQDRLGLTDEQMAAIREVNARHTAVRKQLGQSLREARNELTLAALNGGDVKGKAAVVTALVGQMTELHATTLQEIAPILTPAQRDAMTKPGPNGHRGHHGSRPAES